MPDAWKFFYLYTILITILLSSYTSNGTDIYVDKIDVGEIKNYTLNSTNEYIVTIRNLSDTIVKGPPRIFIKCEDCKEEHPLLVVVMQNKGVLSWELPVVIQFKNYHFTYKNTERTLCPFDLLNSTLVANAKDFFELGPNIVNPFKLSISTCSTKNVTVELLVNIVKNFIIDFKTNRTVLITPSTPSFYLFEFPPENVTSVLLHVSSEDNTCLIVSIQNVSCPLFDLEQNIKYKGYYQTVTRQGGLILNKETFPEGFYVVLIVSGQDNYCASSVFNSVHEEKYNSKERKKTVVISVSQTLSSNEYKIAVLSTIVSILLFSLIMFLVHFFSCKRDKEHMPPLESNEECDPSASESSILRPNIATPVTPITPGTDTLSIKTDSSLDEIDFDLLNDAELDKNIFRMKGVLYVADLARKNQNVLKKKSDTYFWNLLTVATFYFLPVIQLVITNQYQFNVSGEQDLCYYNFLCAHSLWIFFDFNHVFSNIGYISFGILFIFLTSMKEDVYKHRFCTSTKLYKSYGIPQHFGLFYAMGAALIVEGVLSSCYHVCPNHNNFQFDSSFMYVISTLCMIKIYQTRHPDISANANSTFFLLAAVIFIGMCGILSSNLTFWILFTIVHLSTCLYISLKIYYIGRWRLEFCSISRCFREMQPFRACYFKFTMPTFPSRFMLLVVANACNWGLAIASFFYGFKNFSTYLLTIFMVNLMLYTTFYILMKFICKEKLSLQSIAYILLSILCWSSALYFFFSKTISWRLTPAESRLYNQECRLLDFYDNHDIWHFISAAAMFFSFMVLLTLDDDLLYVPRSKIVVF